MRDDGTDEAGRIEAAASFLRERLPASPELLLVLGSGLGELVHAVDGGVGVDYREVPGLPGAGVEGHAGRFVGGRLEGRVVLVQAGRFHLYEGHPPEVVARPVRVAAELGVGVALLTNAAGGIDPRLGPGSILLLDDHVNLMWRNPLVGPVLPGEERFPDMSAPYDPGLQERALAVAREEGLRLHRGTYAGVLGPSYETPAEIRMLGGLGADAVGMSTVPEVTAARARGIRCLGLSLVTNRAAGLSDEPLSHEEVVETGRRTAEEMTRLVRGIVRGL